MSKRWIPLIALGVLLYVARPILPPFIIAAILAYLLAPAVKFITERARCPRGLVIVLFALIALAAIGSGGALLIHRVILEIRSLFNEGPDILATALSKIDILLASTGFSLAGNVVVVQRLREFDPASALHVAGNASEVLAECILTLVATIYLLVDGPHFPRALMRFVAPQQRDRVSLVGRRIDILLHRYLRAQFLLIALMAVTSYIVLGLVLHMRHALPLAIMVGVLEVLPIVGPAIAMIITAAFALVGGGVNQALIVLAALFILRQLEDHLVMPFVVGRSMHIFPVLTMFSVLIGGIALGLIGVLIAVPIAASINVILDEAYPSLNPAQAQEMHDVAATVSKQDVLNLPHRKPKDVVAEATEVIANAAGSGDTGSQQKQ